MKIQEPLQTRRDVFSRMSSTDSYHMGAPPFVVEESFVIDTSSQDSNPDGPELKSQNSIQEELEDELDDETREQGTLQTSETEEGPLEAPEDRPLEAPLEAPEDRPVEGPLEAPEETDSGFKLKLKSQTVVMAPSQPVLQTLLHPTTKPPPVVPPSSPTPVRRTFGAPFTPNQSSLIWTKARSLSCPRKQSPVLNHTHQTGHLANGRCLDQCSSSSSSVDSLELVPSCRSVGTRQKDGTLQREMKALFDQKIKELRCKSPLFLDEKL